MLINKKTVFILAFSIFGAGAVSATPIDTNKPAKAAYQHQESGVALANVDSVDTSTRTLILTDTNGVKYVLHAGPAVNNLSQLNPGDKLSMHIVASIAASLVDKNDRTSVEVKDRQSSTEGSLPSYHFKTSINTTVQILNISKKRDLITVRTAKGKVQKIQIKKPELQKQLLKIKAGDNVAVEIIMLIDVNKLPTTANKN